MFLKCLALFRKNGPKYIASPRLYAKPFEPTDFEHFVALHKDAETSKLMGKGVISDEEIQSRFTRNLAHQERCGYSAWAVFEKETNRFVGRCGLVEIGTLVETDEDHSDKVEIGYAFLPDFWGKGYCQEIVPIVLDYGLNDCNLETIYAKTAKDNAKSRHLLTAKFGFTFVEDIMIEGKPSSLFKWPN